MTIPPTASAPAVPESGGKKFWRFVGKNWIAIVLGILAIIFIIENLALFTMVDVSLYFWTLRLPFWLVIAVVFGVGWLIGWILTRRRAKQKRAAQAAAAAVDAANKAR